MADGSKKVVLIVEDDENLLRALSEKLKGLEYEVVQAKTGQQGMNRAKSLPPNLILLDIMLPGGMNGFDVLEYLKKNPDLKSVPVIVLTNLDTEQKTAMEIGAVDYIVKANISLEDLVLKIKNHLA